MIRMEAYPTVRRGTMYVGEGAEVVLRDGFWVLREGRCGSHDTPRETILPPDVRGEVDVREYRCDVYPTQYYAVGRLIAADGALMRTIEEPGGGFTPIFRHDTPEAAIRSLFPDGFPLTVIPA